MDVHGGGRGRGREGQGVGVGGDDGAGGGGGGRRRLHKSHVAPKQAAKTGRPHTKQVLSVTGQRRLGVTRVFVTVT